MYALLLTVSLIFVQSFCAMKPLPSPKPARKKKDVDSATTQQQSSRLSRANSPRRLPKIKENCPTQNKPSLSQEPEHTIFRTPTESSLSRPPKEKPSRKYSDPHREPSIFSTPPAESKIKIEEQPKKSRPFFPISFGKKGTSPEDSPRKLETTDSPRKTRRFSSHSPKKKDNYLIEAIIKNDLEPIKIFLNDPDNNPNQQTIDTLNTLLHIAVLRHNEKVAMLLLQNPRVDSLTINKEKYAPFQCIINEDIIKHKKLYDGLKLRANLDQVINAMIMTDASIMQDHDERLMQKLYAVRMRIAETIPVYADAKFMFAMIRSRFIYNLAAIKMLINERKNNPKLQDGWGNTLIHDAVYLQDQELLIKVLKNPSIDSLIKNHEGLLAHQLILPNRSELRLLLFARNSLDFWIGEQLQSPSFVLAYPKGGRVPKLEDRAFQEIVKDIKDKSEQIKNAQKGKTEEDDDRALPQTTTYPDYADEKFLLEAFITRMKDDKPTNPSDSFLEKAAIEAYEASLYEKALADLHKRAQKQRELSDSPLDERTKPLPGLPMEINTSITPQSFGLPLEEKTQLITPEQISQKTNMELLDDILTKPLRDIKLTTLSSSDH